jgi:asparagine synthase (glutamine-hydrolysing)
VNSNAKVIFNGDGSDELTGGYLYFHKAPNTVEFDLECRRLLSDIYLFDVLRSDKSISSHGLEPRTPFLDRAFVQTYLSIPAKVRCHSTHGMCEKHLLRFAFHDFTGVDGRPLLPNDILWRTKEAFSDGVSKQSRSLYEIIQDYIKTIFITNPNKTYEWNPPKTEEQEYYRWLFESYFPDRGSIVPYMWMPRFVEDATDASARTLAVYKEINKNI